MFGFQQFLHDGNLLNGKNQVADYVGILKKIGARIFNFGIIIVESWSSLACAAKAASRPSADSCWPGINLRWNPNGDTAP